MTRDKAVRSVLMATTIAFAGLIFVTSVNWSTRPALEAVNNGSAAAVWEFWLNRYQGLVGSVATLAAGVIAYVAVQRQINQTKVQAMMPDLAILRQATRDLLWINDLQRAAKVSSGDVRGLSSADALAIVRESQRHIAEQRAKVVNFVQALLKAHHDGEAHQSIAAFGMIAEMTFDGATQTWSRVERWVPTIDTDPFAEPKVVDLVNSDADWNNQQRSALSGVWQQLQRSIWREIDLLEKEIERLNG